MAHSSILGGASAPRPAKGRDTGALGPSDSSDSGSDVQGERASIDTTDAEERESAVPVALDSDSDAAGTGERGAAVPDGARDAGDINADAVVDLFGDEVQADGDELVDVDVEDLADDDDGESADDEDDDGA